MRNFRKIAGLCLIAWASQLAVAQARADAPVPVTPSASSTASARPATTIPAESAASFSEQQAFLPGEDASFTPAAPPLPVLDVRYVELKLTVMVRNEKLGSLLAAVSASTGVVFDVPEAMASAPVNAEIGPADLRDALVALFKQAGVDYVMAGDPEEPGSVERVILRLRQESAAEDAIQAGAGVKAAETLEYVPIIEPDENGDPREYASGLTQAESLMTPEELLDRVRKARAEAEKKTREEEASRKSQEEEQRKYR